MSFLLSSVLFQYPLMIFFPLALGWWIRRRYRVGWGIFWAGAATFILSQIVHLPLNWALGLLGGGRGVALWPLAAMALVAGLSAACAKRRPLDRPDLLPETVPPLGPGSAIRRGARRRRGDHLRRSGADQLHINDRPPRRSTRPCSTWRGEAAEQAQAQMAQYWATPWYMSVLAGLERVFAITLQIAMALLVVRSVARRQPLYLLDAIGLHTVVDFWAVWGMRTLGVVWVEVGVAVFAAFAFWLILRLKEPVPEPIPVRSQRRPSPPPTSPPAPSPQKSLRAGQSHRSTNSIT